MTKISTSPMLDASGAMELSKESQQLNQAKNLANQSNKTEAEIEKAASGFEALLLHQMMKSMWATVEQTGLLGEKSNSSQMYQDMFHQALSDSISEGKGIGLKDYLKEELTKAQSASKK